MRPAVVFGQFLDPVVDDRHIDLSDRWLRHDSANPFEFVGYIGRSGGWRSRRSLRPGGRHIVKRDLGVEIGDIVGRGLGQNGGSVDGIVIGQGIIYGLGTGGRAAHGGGHSPGRSGRGHDTGWAAYR